jgi:hypothetical protein
MVTGNVRLPTTSIVLQAGNAVRQKDDILFTHNVLFPTIAQSQLPLSYMFRVPILAIIKELQYYKGTKAYHMCVNDTYIHISFL